MKAKISLLLLLLLVLTAGAAHAQSTSLSVKVSSLGLGVELERSFSSWLGGRVGVHYLNFNFDTTQEDIDYDFGVNYMSFAALMDVHPFKGGFRITGGALFNNNEIDAIALPASSYDIGGIEYPASAVGTLSGTMNFDDVSPYFGIGLDTSFGEQGGLGFVLELGAIYQGTPTVDLSVSGPIASDPTFQDELAKEEADLQEDIENYEFYPLLSLGLAYRF